MISEKTVELNITTELVNWYFSEWSVRPFILAPSQPKEATLGYDVQIGTISGKSLFIQYKRAEKDAVGFAFHLNRTAKKDQLALLKNLEAKGAKVVYALPLFCEEAEVKKYRRFLLPHMLFIRPSKICPKGGDIGEHTIKYDTTTKSCRVFSEEGVEIENDAVMDCNKVFGYFNEEPLPLQTVMGSIKEVFSNVTDDDFYEGNSLFCVPDNE
jgi:hypothetical protein